MEQNIYSAAAHSAAPWYRFKASSKSQENTLWILDDVGSEFGGVTVQAFQKELAALDSSLPLVVKINSNGGSFREGLGIANILRGYPNTVAVIIGVAASVSSVIALSCKTVRAVKGSLLAIHNAWTVACGDFHKLRDVANSLEVANESILKVYLDRTKNNALSREQIVGMMNRETWIPCDTEAVNYGWVDTVEADTQRIAACLSHESQRFKNFKNLPSELAAAHSAEQDHTLWLRRRQLELLF